MSATSVYEINQGRQGEGTVTREKSFRTYQRVFRVTTDDPYDDSLVVFDAVSSAYGVVAGAPYPTDFGAFVNKAQCRPEGKSKMVWLVTVSYTSEWEPQQNPLDDPAIIEWSATPYQRAYTLDKDGNAILNKANMSYYQPVMGDDSRWEVRVQKNLAQVPQWIIYYKDAVNDGEFTIDGVDVDQYQAKVSAIGIGKVQTRNNIDFRVLSYTLHLDFTSTDDDGNPCGWIKQILNEGLYQISFATGKLTRCTDDTGAPVGCRCSWTSTGCRSTTPRPTRPSTYPNTFTRNSTSPSCQ